MSFKDRIGDEKLIERLSKSILSGSVSHAYIFEGDLSSDLYNFSLDFIKAILCKNEIGIGCDNCINCNKINHGNYEDLYIVDSTYNQSKTVKSVRDEDILDLQVKLKNRPNNERNIALIKDCDTLTIRAQNRLLKTLEEPNDGTVIILLVKNMENLIDTVKSRAIKYHIYGSSFDTTNLSVSNELIDMIFNNDNFFNVKEFLRKNVKDREEALMLLDDMEKVLRNMVLEDLSDKRKEKAFKLVDLIEEARKDIVYKVSYMNALKNLVLKI